MDLDRLLERYTDRHRTHWEGCVYEHPGCAVVALIARVRDAEQVQGHLSRGLDQAQDLIRELHDDHALMLSIIKGAHGAIADTGTIPLGALCESADELAVAVRALTAERDRYRAGLERLISGVAGVLWCDDPR